jgi:hypothetical protein
MTMLNTTRLLSLVLALGGVIAIAATVTTGAPPPQAPDGVGFGPAKDGLRLGLRITTDREIVVCVRNTGEKATCVNLGMNIANGRRYEPSSLRLVVDTATGDRREFALLTPPIGGRVDDYLVPLRAGSSHTLRLSMSDFRSSTGTQAEPPPAGRYTMTLTSGKPTFINHDMAGVGLLEVWSGTLESATIRVAMPESH